MKKRLRDLRAEAEAREVERLRAEVEKYRALGIVREMVDEMRVLTEAGKARPMSDLVAAVRLCIEAVAKLDERTRS